MPGRFHEQARAEKKSESESGSGLIYERIRLQQQDSRVKANHARGRAKVNQCRLTRCRLVEPTEGLDPSEVISGPGCLALGAVGGIYRPSSGAVERPASALRVLLAGPGMNSCRQSGSTVDGQKVNQVDEGFR